MLDMRKIELVHVPFSRFTCGTDKKDLDVGTMYGYGIYTHLTYDTQTWF